MADSRIKDVAGTVIEGNLPALLNTLYLAVDDTTFSEFKKILLKTILSEVVVSANTNNYQAMTPKAFYDSVMTTTRKGIGQLATDGEVTTKAGSGLLNSVHQILMQAQWYTDWFVKNGYADGAVYKSTTNMEAFSFDVNLYAQFTQYQTAQINLVLPAGKRMQGVIFQVICNHSSNTDQYVAFDSLKYNGTTRYYWINGSGLGFMLSADGRTFAVVSNYSTGYVTLSAKLNVICKDI